MPTNSCLKVVAIALLSLTVPSLVVAETPPARTFQPGPWQPVARVDIKRPVEIQIINKTDLLLDYDLTSNSNPAPQQIIPGETTTLRGFTVPAYILVNRSIAASDQSPLSLNYEVSVDENNVIKLTITRSGEGGFGYSTFNLNREGAIYIY